MTRSRVASLAFALGLLAVALLRAYWKHEDLLLALKLASGPMVFGLVMIWFPERMGEHVSSPWYLGQNRIDEPSPPLMVSIVGWIMLVLMPLIIFLMAWR